MVFALVLLGTYIDLLWNEFSETSTYEVCVMDHLQVQVDIEIGHFRVHFSLYSYAGLRAKSL